MTTKGILAAVTAAAIAACGPAAKPPATPAGTDASIRALVACGSQVSVRGEGLLVTPNGSDDTAALQCALDASAGRTVRLAPGTFRIAQIVASGFTGRLAGAGVGRTTVSNVDRQIPTTHLDYSLAPPSADNPWPVLLNFVGGHFTVSDFSVRILGDYPMTEWISHGYGSRSVGAVISITGDRAEAVLERLDVEGAPAPDPISGFNVVNAVFTWNIIGTDPLPLEVKLDVHQCRFASLGSGLPMANLRHSEVTITGNRFEGTLLASELIDLSETSYRFADNDASTLYLAIDQYDFCAGEHSVCGIHHASILVADNHLSGGAVAFEGTMHDGVECRVVDDEFVDMAWPFDVFLGPGSSGCLVEGTSRVVDLGTGNRVVP